MCDKCGTPWTKEEAQLALVELGLGEYAVVRERYWGMVARAVQDYLNKKTRRITDFNAQMRYAVAQAFGDAADMGWVDGGAELPLDAEANAWYVGEQNKEFGYVDQLAARYQLLRKETLTEEDVNAEAVARADGYTATLDRIYAGAKVRAAKNKMLTFVGDDGEESCADCKRYKNKRRKAKWWVANDAVPPNPNFECGGYNCQHYLVDDNGDAFTF